MKQPWLFKWGPGERLDQGGQGETFAVPNKIDPKGVLKVILEGKKQDPKARGRMSQEITNLRTMKAAGAKVPQVYECNPQDISDLETELYFVMEFISGQTLAHLTQSRHGLSLEESVRICLEITKTLQIAVSIPIFHRDLKPENLMIRNLASFDIVMLDFGISFHGNQGPNLTAPDETFQNGLIRLPERTGINESKRDFRSDLTDVTAILYYCLSSQPPRNLKDSHGNPISRSIQAILKQKCSSENQFRRVNGFLERGLQEDIDDRFQSVIELQGRLTELLNGGASATTEDLASTLNRCAKILRNDRNTQILNYRAEIEKGIQNFERALYRLPLPVVRKLGSIPNLLDLQTMPNSSKGEKDFVIVIMDALDRFRMNHSSDRVYLYQLEVVNTPNSITYVIEFEFLLLGNECACHRTISYSTHSARRVVAGPEAVERFSSLDQVNLDCLITSVESAVTICINLITDKLTSK